MKTEWIPNINIGEDYDLAYQDATIHFDKLGKLADFFGRDMPMHLHSEYCQFHFVQSGKTLFNIDQNTYQTQGKALFYTPSSTPHAFWTEPDAPGFVITMHRLVLEEIIEQLNIDRTTLYMPLVLHSEQTDTPQWQTIETLFSLLRNEWHEQRALQYPAMVSILKLLIITMVRLSEAKSPKNQHKHTEVTLFRKFSHLVESHYIEHRNVSFYCEHLHLNESRLHYICKKIAGSSPKQIINGRVILEAKRLLSHTNLSLSEISYHLNMLEPSYFSRFFMRKTGLSPTDFRNQQSNQ